YVYFLMPSGVLGIGHWGHAWPMALMVWAVFAYRRPMVAGALLGVAAGSVFFPIWTVPVWLSFYRGRGAARFGSAFVLAVVSYLFIVGLVLALNGEGPPRNPPEWTQPTWWPWYENKDLPSVWQGVGWVYRIP